MKNSNALFLALLCGVSASQLSAGPRKKMTTKQQRQEDKAALEAALKANNEARLASSSSPTTDPGASSASSQVLLQTKKAFRNEQLQVLLNAQGPRMEQPCSLTNQGPNNLRKEFHQSAGMYAALLAQKKKMKNLQEKIDDPKNSADKRALLIKLAQLKKEEARQSTHGLHSEQVLAKAFADLQDTKSHGNVLMFPGAKPKV